VERARAPVFGTPRLAVAIVLVAAGCLWPAGAKADFTVGPAVRELRVAPGEAVAGSFDVRLERERRDFVVEVQDVVQLADGGYAYRRAHGSRFSASSWLTVAPRSFAGRPDRTQPVEFRLRVPRAAEPGDHVASITVMQAPRPEEAGAVAVQAISFRLHVRVPGEVNERVEIGPIAAPALAGRGPIEVAVVVRNTGNVRLDFDRPNRGALWIGSSRDPEARLRLRGQLYPGRARAFNLRWDEPPTLARLTTHASVRTRTGTVTRSQSFWMVPWRQAGALLLVALAAGFVHVGRRRRIRRYARAA
jgi:hypothetical protein